MDFDILQFSSALQAERLESVKTLHLLTVDKLNELVSVTGTLLAAFEAPDTPTPIWSVTLKSNRELARTAMSKARLATSRFPTDFRTHLEQVEELNYHIDRLVSILTGIPKEQTK